MQLIKKTISELLADGMAMERALQKAVRIALLEHKRAGNPICVWRDGQVVWIPPEEIPVDDRPPENGPVEPL